MQRLYENLSALSASADSALKMAITEQKCINVLRNVLHGDTVEDE